MPAEARAVTSTAASLATAPAASPAALLQQQLQALVTELSPAGGEVARVRRLSGGASQETWAFELQQAGGKLLPLVLRRAPAGAAARGGGAIGMGTEAALIRRAAAVGVPVPQIVLLLRPEHGAGEGFVMHRLAGETLGRKIVADPRFATARQTLAWQCGQTLARIHQIERSTLPVLRQASAEVELAHCHEWHRAHAAVRPVFQLAMRWLQAHLPPAASGAAEVLVHGDFRNGNLMVDEAGLRGVLDWELAHLGDPMEDLGWLCVNSWRFGNTELPVGGFGSLDQLFAGYTEAGGQVDTARVHWWQVMGSLKWGIGCETLLQTYLDGNEPEVEKAAIGRRASETEIDLMQLLAPGRQPAVSAAAAPRASGTTSST